METIRISVCRAEGAAAVRGSEVLEGLHKQGMFDQYAYAEGQLANSADGWSAKVDDTAEAFLRAMLEHADSLWSVSYLDAMLDYGYSLAEG